MSGYVVSDIRYPAGLAGDDFPAFAGAWRQIRGTHLNACHLSPITRRLIVL